MLSTGHPTIFETEIRNEPGLAIVARVLELDCDGIKQMAEEIEGEASPFAQALGLRYPHIGHPMLKWTLLGRCCTNKPGENLAKILTRTAKGLPGKTCKTLLFLARPARLERATCGFELGRSAKIMGKKE